jgi:hypothetical protein
LGPFKAIIMHDHAYFFSVERSAIRSALHRLKGALVLRTQQIDFEALRDPEVTSDEAGYGNFDLASIPFELVIVEHILEEICGSYQVLTMAVWVMF